MVEVGADVTHVAQGDFVAVEGHHFCRVCPQCRRGATNLCVHYDEFGFTRAGGLAELVAVRGDLLHPFRRELRPDIAALTEPAACALHGVELAAPRPGETVVVIGPGTITPFLFEDYTAHILAMQAVPQPHVNWKTLLLKGQLAHNHIEQTGQPGAKLNLALTRM